MAVRDTKLVRLKKWFIENFLDKIIEQEKKRGRSRTGYPEASEILGKRIINAGGLKEIR